MLTDETDYDLSFEGGPPSLPRPLLSTASAEEPGLMSRSSGVDQTIRFLSLELSIINLPFNPVRF